MTKATITLQESGYQFEVDPSEFLAELAQHGDNPAEYSEDLDDFAFVGKEYAKNDPDWNYPGIEQWPDHLPLWVYRPA